MERMSSLDPDTLLKEATSQKKAGRIDYAIDLLRNAYALIARSSIEYPVQTFLRLPLFLQAAGRNDEAWREFNLLLINGYPNQSKSSKIIPMDHCNIYDKMRLFLQREGKVDRAVSFGVLSFLSWAVGLHRQKRKAELSSYISPDNVEAILHKLLKKAGKEHLLDRISGIVNKEVANLPNISFAEVTNRITPVVLD